VTAVLLSLLVFHKKLRKKVAICSLMEVMELDFTQIGRVLETGLFKLKLV
jgi:hypothetical protein